MGVHPMLYAAVICLFLVCCQSPEKKRLNQYYMNKCIHVDSIHQYYFVQNDPIKYIQNICNSYSHLAQVGLADSAKKFIGYMQRQANQTSNERYLNYHYLNYAYHHLNNGEVDSARLKFEIRNRYAAEADLTNQLMATNFLGTLLFVEGKIDSARMEFVRGFEMSKEIGDTLQRFTLAVNAGATCNELGLNSAATYYFSEAYAMSQKMKYPSLMMLNNLVASLITEKNYAKATQLCEQSKSVWLNNDKDQAAILLQLNYINLLSISKKAQPMLPLLNAIDPGKLNAIYWPLYHRLRLEALLFTNQYAKFHQTIDTLQGYIYRNQPQTVVRLNPMLFSAMDRVGFPLRLDSLLLSYQHNFRDWDLATRWEYADLISEVYDLQGNEAKSLFWKKQGLDDRARLVEVNDSLRAADIGEQIDNTILKNSVIQKQIELTRKSDRNTQLTYGLIASLLLLLSAFVAFFLYRKNGRKKLAIIALEARLASQELEILKRDKEMKENVVAISQSVLEQISQIVQKIRSANFSKDPEAVAIRQDLVRLTQLSQAFIEPNLSDTVYDSYNYLFEDLPSLSELNVTEKRIFVLTVLGNRPKEIAALLNLNDQYIRNVKSKIKKLLPLAKQELPWSEFRRTS